MEKSNSVFLLRHVWFSDAYSSRLFEKNWHRNRNNGIASWQILSSVFPLKKKIGKNQTKIFFPSKLFFFLKQENRNEILKYKLIFFPSKLKLFRQILGQRYNFNMDFYAKIYDLNIRAKIDNFVRCDFAIFFSFDGKILKIAQNSKFSLPILSSLGFGVFWTLLERLCSALIWLIMSSLALVEVPQT